MALLFCLRTPPPLATSHGLRITLSAYSSICIEFGRYKNINLPRHVRPFKLSMYPFAQLHIGRPLPPTTQICSHSPLSTSQDRVRAETKDVKREISEKSVGNTFKTVAILFLRKCVIFQCHSTRKLLVGMMKMFYSSVIIRAQ